MQYKIHEVSKITGIPVDTLRYYEKIGVISPKIDESNRYRYYDAWDINFILDYYNYRKLEYSSKEALHFTHHATLDEQIQMLSQKAEFYQKQMEHYRRLKTRTEEIREQVQKIRMDEGRISIVQSPPYRYIRYRENYSFFGFQEYMEELHKWLARIEQTDNVILIPKEVLEEQSDNRYSWGLLVKEEDFEELELPLTENVEYIEGSLCVRITAEAGGEGTFHYQMLEPAMEFIRQHRFKLKGDPFGILLIRSHDERVIHRFFDFYLPIQ